MWGCVGGVGGGFHLVRGLGGRLGSRRQVEEGRAVGVLPDAAAPPLAQPGGAEPGGRGHVHRVRTQNLLDELGQVLTLSLRTEGAGVGGRGWQTGSLRFNQSDPVVKNNCFPFFQCSGF